MPNDLSDIKPKEISLVDKPANKKEFLFFKSEKGGKMPDDAGNLNFSNVSAPVLKKFIEDMKPSVEKLVSLTANLETLQKNDEQEGSTGDDALKEFKGIKKSLDDLLEKCSTIEKDNKEKNMPEGDDKGKKSDFSEELKKTLEAFNKKIDGIAEKVEKMGEKDPKEEEPKGDDGNKDDKDVDNKDDKNIDTDAIVEKIQKDLMDKVEKALDKRAENLVGLFQEAAKEEFKGLFEGVEANKAELQRFKKALSGGETEGDEGGEDYVRNYGDQEREEVASVEHKDNPFHGLFTHIDSRSS
jgi:formate dehydrogenase maturation protein FdhE